MNKYLKLFNDQNLKKLKIRKLRSSNNGVVKAVCTADFLYYQIIKDKREYLIPSFIYALCSIIEENINCNFIDYFYSKFGEDYKSFSSVYIRMSFHDKLKVFIPTISDFKYDLNHEKNEIKIIKKMFDIRNQLIHIKQHYKSSMLFETNDGELFISNLDENELDIYDDLLYKKFDKNTLKDFYKAQQVFTPKIGQLFYTINRKNFNPQDWLIKLEKKENKFKLNRKNN